MLQFDWDPEKAASNERKHGVPFPEAATAFGDPLSITIPDPQRSVGEARYVLLGLTYKGRLVVVAHAETGDWLRIISARGPPQLNANHMSKKPEPQPEPDMREEYDFRGGKRGRYAARYAEGSNVIVLDPDVADVFPDARAVNEALSVLARSVRGAENAS